jgi:ribosomal-protein-serine acetyltransferase
MILQVSDDIELHSLSEEHVEDIYHTIDREREYLRVWLPFVDATVNIDFTRNYVRSAMQSADPTFAIFYKGRFAGLVGFRTTDTQNRRTEIGYWMSQHLSGRGIMTMSVGKLIEYAFREMGMHRVQIRAAVGNLRSRLIPERLNFTFEGIELDGELLSCGEYTDIAVYSLLNNIVS